VRLGPKPAVRKCFCIMLLSQSAADELLTCVCAQQVFVLVQGGVCSAGVSFLNGVCGVLGGQSPGVCADGSTDDVTRTAALAQWAWHFDVLDMSACDT